MSGKDCLVDLGIRGGQFDLKVGGEGLEEQKKRRWLGKGFGVVEILSVDQSIIVRVSSLANLPNTPVNRFSQLL